MKNNHVIFNRIDIKLCPYIRKQFLVTIQIRLLIECNTQVDLSGNPFSCLLQPALQFSWRLWSIPFSSYQPPGNE
jgi:hypothetical protein